MQISAAIEVLTIFQKYETTKKKMVTGALKDQVILGNPAWKISTDDQERLTKLGLHLTESNEWVYYT